MKELTLRPTPGDVHAYQHVVNKALEGQPLEWERFLWILEAVMLDQIPIIHVLLFVCTILGDFPLLLDGFNRFLPAGYMVVVDYDFKDGELVTSLAILTPQRYMSPKEVERWRRGLTYLKALKAASDAKHPGKARNGRKLFPRYVGTLIKMKNEQLSVEQAIIKIANVCAWFGHCELIDGIRFFIPPGYAMEWEYNVDKKLRITLETPTSIAKLTLGTPGKEIKASKPKMRASDLEEANEDSFSSTMVDLACGQVWTASDSRKGLAQSWIRRTAMVVVCVILVVFATRRWTDRDGYPKADV